jgi:hypothetical protein
MLLNEDIAADVVAYDKAGKLILMAEAKGMPGRTAEWAARFRLNLLERDPQRNPEYFLIVTSDWVFFWNHAGNPYRLPDATLEAAPLLQPQMDRLQRRLSQLGTDSFRMVVGNWIHFLELEELPAEHPLAGLVKALGQARIETNI